MLLSVCDFLIRYSYFALLIVVPFIFTGNTSELFEFNKMWVTFGFTIVISFAWITKMIARKKVLIQRTPLDIPILLFTASQIISTLFSLDHHISIWGYYTRFNGGLLSTFCYVILYYAFATNFAGQMLPMVKKLLGVTIFAAILVSLWGLPSHFGYDPTCFAFRGHLDVSCWTADFQPMIRIFSSLGQPDWLAAYLDIAIFISMALGLFHLTKISSKKSKIMAGYYLFATVLFYIDLNFTKARSGYAAFWIAFLIFLGFLLYKKFLLTKLVKKALIVVVGLIAIITLFVDNPFPQLYPYTIPQLVHRVQTAKKAPTSKSANKITPQTQAQAVPSDTIGGSDSGIIRKYVWAGALDAAKHNPLFGTGVETFAFAYYRYKPLSHNLTTEWDFLYNKAHNEYLNYLATTGIVGLGTYLAMIALFIWLTAKKLLIFSQDEMKTEKGLVTLGLLCSYLTILITDFFGFSVVITNIYLFLIPLLVFAYYDMLSEKIFFSFPHIDNAHLPAKNEYVKVTFGKLLIIISVGLVSANMLYNLYTSWDADKHYYLGYNYDKINQYITAYKELHLAAAERGDEPVFSDELSVNDAIIATQLAYEKDATQAAQVAQESLTVTNKLTTTYPNNVLFWKSRTRIFYTLAQVDPHYLPFALSAIQKAAELAPTDAKISYNLGILYGQTGDTAKGIETLKNTIHLKPDYADAYYALGLFYRAEAANDKGVILNHAKEKLAVDQMKHVLSLDPANKSASDALKSWGENE